MRNLDILGASGARTLVSSSHLDALARDLAGTLLCPGDTSYDAVRRVWNGMVEKRPALIARPAHTQDVIRCVRFARDHDLLVSVRGGGHNYAGASVCQDGMMIDLSAMRAVTVDPLGRCAQAAAGVRLGEFDTATSVHGLATTLGVNTDTGIAGLTLGGGYGWLAGRFGLACDNLLAAELVTADAQRLFTSSDENPDLLWGLRGGGANLGVVTRFHYRLHPLEQVYGGLVLYPMTQAHAALRLFDTYSAECADEVSTGAFIIQMPDGEPVVAIGICHSGPSDRAEQAVAPLLRSVPIRANLLETQPYTRLQTLFDAAWPPGRLYYNKSSVMRRLSSEAIDCLLDFAQTLPTGFSAIAFQQLHGAATRVGITDTAFPHRFDHFCMYVHPATDDPAQASSIIDWGRRCWDAMQPYTEQAVYVNALENAEEEGFDRVRRAYGANYDKLVTLKQRYDPSNFFTANANVPPH